MKKITSLLCIFCALMLFASACAEPIRGAARHRKDKDCGCEYQAPAQPVDSLNTLTSL